MSEFDESLSWALRQFVRIVPAGKDCAVRFKVGVQEFTIGTEPLPEDEAAHFAALFVIALAGACQQVTAGKAIDWSTDAPGCLGDPGMPPEDDIDQAFCHAIATAELSDDEAVIACQWFSVGALEFAARARAAGVEDDASKEKTR